MLIFGAKGFAIEVLNILSENQYKENIVFYDDISNDLDKMLYSKYPILKNKIEVQEFFFKKWFFFYDWYRKSKFKSKDI